MYTQTLRELILRSAGFPPRLLLGGGNFTLTISCMQNQGRKKMFLDGEADLVGGPTYLGGAGGMLPQEIF